MNGMLGSGIQILVDKDDFERANQILDKGNNRDVQVCPNCNSTNIKYGLGTKHRLKKLLAIFIALVVASPVRHIRQLITVGTVRLSLENNGTQQNVSAMVP